MVSLAFPQSALQNWLRPERSGQLARVVNILLVVWLAWLLAGLSWLLFPEPENVPQAPPRVSTPAAQRSQSQVDEQQIAAWHIFGEAGVEETVVQPVTVDAPDTSLKLTLRGVFASDEPGEARAIIGDPRGQEEHYSVGDPLPGNAKLTEIHTDRIILERNGRYETLRLPRDLTPAGSTGTGVAPQAGGATSAVGTAAAFARYRNEVRQNPSTFLNYVRATPARQDGRFIGFRLQAGRERGALKELGLKPGDIVTSINGVQIDSPARGMQAMQALGEGDRVNVTLLRGGQETSLNLVLPSGGQ